MLQPRDWLQIHSPAQVDPHIRLGAGESAAICLAVELRTQLILIDDRRARRVAAQRGLSVVGTINILEAGAKRDLLDLPAAIEGLRRTNFHIADVIIEHVLKNDALRREKKER